MDRGEKYHLDFWKLHAACQATYLEFISWAQKEKKKNRKPSNRAKYESSVAAQLKSQRAAASAACLRVGARAPPACTCLFVCLVDPAAWLSIPGVSAPPSSSGCWIMRWTQSECRAGAPRSLCLRLYWCVTPPRPSLRNRCMRTKRTPRTCRLFTPAASHGMTQSVRQTLGQTRAATHGSSCSRLPVDGNPLVSQSDLRCLYTCTVSSFLNQNSVSVCMSFIWCLSVFSIPAQNRAIGAPMSQMQRSALFM